MTLKAPITVGIPVGPHESQRRWLGEALGSVRRQTMEADEILLFFDGGDPGVEDMGDDVSICQTPWPVGPVGAFNCVVGAARNPLILLMGSDDKLYPDCVRQCWEAWRRYGDAEGYYYLDVAYSDGRGVQTIPCNAAMVTKELWKLTGGFPLEGAVGAMDTMLISMILAAEGRLGRLYRVSDEPLYWYRVHAEIETLKHGAEWQGVIFTVRDLVTRRALGRLT